jgi:hypothetical protein
MSHRKVTKSGHSRLGADFHNIAVRKMLDPDGAVVPSVEKIANYAVGLPRMVKTNEQCVYQFVEIPLATYTFTIQALGCRGTAPKDTSVANLRFRNVMNEFFYEIAFRIEDSNTLVLADIVKGARMDERRFPMRGFSSDVQVLVSHRIGNVVFHSSEPAKTPPMGPFLILFSPLR